MEGTTFTADAVARAAGIEDRDEVVDFLDDWLVADESHESGILEDLGIVSISDPPFEPRQLCRYRFRADLYRWALVHYGLREFEPAGLSAASRRMAAILTHLYAPEEHRIAGLLSRLYKEGGDFKLAREFRQLADVPLKREALLWLALASIDQGKRHWSREDAFWTLQLLLKAVPQLRGSIPYSQLLRLAEEAQQLADEVGARQDRAQAFTARGMVHFDLGDMGQALLLFEKALAIYREVGDRTGEAAALASLGSVLQAQGDLAGSRPYCERALAIHEKVLGPDHPDTVTVRANLRALDD